MGKGRACDRVFRLPPTWSSMLQLSAIRVKACSWVMIIPEQHLSSERVTAHKILQ